MRRLVFIPDSEAYLDLSASGLSERALCWIDIIGNDYQVLRKQVRRCTDIIAHLFLFVLGIVAIKWIPVVESAGCSYDICRNFFMRSYHNYWAKFVEPYLPDSPYLEVNSKNNK